MLEIIIDTDPGYDDALAIMMACKSGFFKIHALTTVMGNSTIENTTRNARYILELLGREDIPVYSGAEQPLEKPLMRSVFHGESGLGGIDPVNDPALTGDAADRILNLARLNPGKLTLVCLAPLTNIALAIRKDPAAFSLFKELVILGGSIRAPGNKGPVSEFNFFVDPEAAAIVLDFDVSKTLITLDACYQAVLQLSEFEGLKPSALKEAVFKMMQLYIDNNEREEGIRGAIMYDPLPFYYLMNRSSCRTSEYDLRIETRGELTRGMSVADLRRNSLAAPNVSVVERMDFKAFNRDFIDILNR